MFVYDNEIIDNFKVLKEVRDIINSAVYDRLLCVWGADDWKLYEQQIENSSNDSDDITWDFAKTLYEARQFKESLLSDNLFGIYAGLLPEKDRSDNLLPLYFIFRCSNNGRSLLISTCELK